MLLSISANLGYGALAAFVGAESAGLPVPGETALVAGALLAAAGHLSLPAVIVVAAVAAIAGDNLGYWIGRRAGRRALLARRGPFRRHRQRALAHGEAFFARHGARAVFFGRWVPGVRVVAAVVAGATRMPVRSFLIANALGAFAWAGTTASVVFLLGPTGGIIVLLSGLAVAAGATLTGVVAKLRTHRRSVTPTAIVTGGAS